jgi:hypothetical protein
MQNKNFQLNLSKSYVMEIDGDARTVYRFIASTESIDRSGEVILLSAWDFTNYDKHPVILDTHKSWEIEHIVGKCVKKEVTDKEFTIDVLFSESNPKGALIEEMLEEGMPIATSVGFIPEERENRDGVTYITKAQLLEVSMVVLPCNQDAVQIMKGLATKHNVDAKDIGVKDIEEVKEPAEDVIVEDEKPVIAETNTETIPQETQPIEEETTDEDTVVTDDGETATAIDESDIPDNAVLVDEDGETVEVEVEDETDGSVEIDVEVTDGEETIEAELEDENEVIAEYEIEISDGPVDNSQTEPEKSVLSSKVEVKAGRTLSASTLATISQARTFAEDSIVTLQNLVATLDNLVNEAGDKSLSNDYITLSKSELKDLQSKVRSSDKSQDEALSILNKFFNK